LFPGWPTPGEDGGGEGRGLKNEEINRPGF